MRSRAASAGWSSTPRQGNKSLGQLVEGWLGMTSAADAAGKSHNAAAGGAFAASWPKAQSYASWVQASARATTALANAQNAAISTQLAYGNDILTSANDAQVLRDKLRASARPDRAAHPGAERLLRRGTAGTSGTWPGRPRRRSTVRARHRRGHRRDPRPAYQRWIPPRRKTSQYWTEVTDAQQLPAQAVADQVHQHAHPRHRHRQVVGDRDDDHPGGCAQPAEHRRRAGNGFAGGRVPFSTGIPGQDSVLVMTKPGEIFVPPQKGPMLARRCIWRGCPVSRRAASPARTGRGAWPGLPRWTQRPDRRDGLTAVAQNTAQAMLNAMAAAQKAAKAAAANPFDRVTGVRPAGRSAARRGAQAFAKSILWAYGWGQPSSPLLALWNGSALAVERPESDQSRLRDPAGPPRVQDGQGRGGLADQLRHPDEVGRRVHQVRVQHPG